MFWVISVYFNIRNTLPKSGTFLLGHPVYTPTHPPTHTHTHAVYINICAYWNRTSIISRYLNRLLHEILIGAPFIVLVIFFCRTKTFPLLEELHQKIEKILEKCNRT